MTLGTPPTSTIPAGRQGAPIEALAAFDFKRASTAAAGNRRLRLAVNNAVIKQDTGRRRMLAELPTAEALRELAGQLKQHTLDYLDYYLSRCKAAVEARGGHFHLAGDGEEATRIILDIARAAGAKSIIKSKSMVSEEIELAHRFEREGFDVVETDLGEFIVQIDRDKPSHIVAPIIHKDCQAVANLFGRYFGVVCENDPVALTKLARTHLRDKFRRADVGMTGGNFVVAETGEVCCVENEGNVRQSTTSPRVLIALVGIEKLVPKMEHLAVMLKLLARSATGQHMTVYTSIFGGPRRAHERDGPQEFHLVLLDNGRSEILASEEYREILRCIRCGACLNACPVYRSIGGHAYGSVYPGPIGALVTPLMQGLEKFGDLPHASSLCGACYEACPVKIDIPKHLVSLRRDMVERRITGRLERWLYRAYASLMSGPRRYRLALALQKPLRWFSRDGYVRRAPPPISAWTKVRDLPAPARKSFRAIWREAGR